MRPNASAASSSVADEATYYTEVIDDLFARTAQLLFARPFPSRAADHASRRRHRRQGRTSVKEASPPRRLPPPVALPSMPAAEALLRLERLCDRLSRAVVQLELELDRIDGGPTAGMTPRRRAVALDVLEYKANLIAVAALVASRRSGYGATMTTPAATKGAAAEWAPCVDGAEEDYAMATLDRYAVLDAISAAAAVPAMGSGNETHDEDAAAAAACVPALVQVECFFDTIALPLAAPSRTANAFADTAAAEIATMRSLAVGHIQQLCLAAASSSDAFCTAGRLEAFVRELASLAADEVRIPRTPGGHPSPDPPLPSTAQPETPATPPAPSDRRQSTPPQASQAPKQHPAAAVAPLVATPNMSDGDATAAVLRFYRAVNPDKTADVPHIVAAYVGRRELLFAMLNHKYLGLPVPDQDDERYDMARGVGRRIGAGCDDDDSDSGEEDEQEEEEEAAAAGGGGGNRVLLLEYEEGLTTAEAVADVRALYEQVAPGKVPEVASIVERHADDLERLYFLLNCKYVPGFEAHYAAALAASKDEDDDDLIEAEESAPLTKEASGASRDTAPSPPHGTSAFGTRAPTPAVGSPTTRVGEARGLPVVAPTAETAAPAGDAAGGAWCLVA